MNWYKKATSADDLADQLYQQWQNKKHLQELKLSILFSVEKLLNTYQIEINIMSVGFDQDNQLYTLNLQIAATSLNLYKKVNNQSTISQIENMIYDKFKIHSKVSFTASKRVKDLLQQEVNSINAIESKSSEKKKTRNSEIVNKHQQGVPLETLAKEYNLSIPHIKTIIYRYQILNDFNILTF